MKVFSIDLATSKTGVAVFHTDKDNDIHVAHKELFKASGRVHVRCGKLVDNLFTSINSHRPDIIICEYPALYSGSEVGMAAKESGRILILFMICGMLYEAVRDLYDIRFVSAIRWKGNLKKHHTAARVLKTYGITDVEDVIDAIGIGDWYIKEGASLDWDGPFLIT